jgi:purine-binding chemotaxis protein CheW
LNDQFIIAQAAGRTVALLVDAATDVVTDAIAATVPGERILPHLDYVAGVGKCGDGLILIHDLDRFLSLAEAQQLDAALPAESGAA